MPNRCYIAGKISDLPEAEWRANFDQAKAIVQQMGFEPISPIDLPHDHDRSWDACMREDITAMLSCDYVYAQNNWTQSKGATLEVTLARALGIQVIGSTEPKEPLSPMRIQLKLWRWQLRNWWRQRNCKHLGKTEVFQYPPDNYVHYHCPDCEKDIFEDLN